MLLILLLPRTLDMLVQLQTRQGIASQVSPTRFKRVLSVKSLQGEVDELRKTLGQHCAIFTPALDRFTTFGAASQELLTQTILAIREKVVLRQHQQAVTTHADN